MRVILVEDDVSFDKDFQDYDIEVVSWGIQDDIGRKSREMDCGGCWNCQVTWVDKKTDGQIVSLLSVWIDGAFIADEGVGSLYAKVDQVVGQVVG